MTTRILLSNSKKNEIGHSNDYNRTVGIQAGGNSDIISTCTSPPSFSWGSTLCVKKQFNRKDRWIIKGCDLNYDLVNSSGTDTMSYKNSYDFLSSLTLELNGEKVIEYKNADEIKNAYSEYYLRFNTDKKMQRQYALDKGAVVVSQNKTIAPGASVSHEVSLMPLIHAALMDSKTENAPKVEFEIGIQANNANAVYISRFCKNDTADTNPLDSLTFINSKVSFRVTSHADEDLYIERTHAAIIDNFETHKVKVDFSTVNTKVKIALSDFSRHGKISKLSWYAYDDTITAFNGASSLTHQNSPADYSLMVSKGGRDWVDLTSEVKRHRHFDKISLLEGKGENELDQGDAYNQNNFTWINQVSFRHLENHDINSFSVYEGIDNDNDIELEFENKTVMSANMCLMFVIQYHEILKVKKTGEVGLFA